MATTTSLPTAVPLQCIPRSGPTYWWHAYRAMLHWEFRSLRQFLPVIVAVQILAGIGFVLGFGLFFPSRIPTTAALYIGTGVPVVNLYLLGLILGPQLVAQQRLTQTYEYLQALPVPRAVTAAAWYTVTLAAGLPAMVVSLVAATVRYQISFSLSPAIVPATVLISGTATLVGYALAHAVPRPMVVQVLTQVFNFFAVGFAPICFPATQLPGWLETVNQFLPFEYMGTAMRGALAPSVATGVGMAYAVLALWACACAALAGWAVERRH